ncbi:OmpA family protein [Desulforhopalus sp. IMCC35007]|uniref:OmpA family protein n=1 Tax=Desulforhopalus sp. IMCC35007 TaxID=2569543 RepID=UPI0010AE6C92|nr:OmpA family protein [Desulforhopalus sp. IMCC35007]TKB11252.1 OmpA family protein [Desulforhopalus sp. IMCC35007]
MKIKHQIIISTLTALLLTPTKSEAGVVRQELYRFQMTMSQNVTSKTFLICDQHQLQEKPATLFRLILVHFELGSALLSAAEAETLLSGLQQHGITGETPLAVIGYTCVFGPDKFNQRLSLKRAEAVADFLRDHGFVVAHVQGQGANNPITYNLQEFYKNRRVQITVCP